MSLSFASYRFAFHFGNWYFCIPYFDVARTKCAFNSIRLLRRLPESVDVDVDADADVVVDVDVVRAGGAGATGGGEGCIKLC